MEAKLSHPPFSRQVALAGFMDLRIYSVSAFGGPGHMPKSSNKMRSNAKMKQYTAKPVSLLQATFFKK